MEKVTKICLREDLKMKWVNNSDIQEMMNCFRRLPLNEVQLQIVENYITGSKGDFCSRISEKELDKIAFVDLLAAEYKNYETEWQFCSLMMKFARKRNRVAGKLLFDTVFAIGRSTSYQYLKYWRDIEKVNRASIYRLSPEKVCSIHAEMLSEKAYSISESNFFAMKRYSENDFEILKKAVSYHKNKTYNGKLLLYASYFWMKYPDIVLGQWELGQAARSVASQEDWGFLYDYEETMLSCMIGFLEKPLKPDQARQFTDAIKTGKIDSTQMIDEYRIAKNTLPLIVGYAYVNAGISNVLENVVKLCIAQYGTQILTIMKNIDIRKDFERCGEDFDKRFNIATNSLIAWAACLETKEENILRKQFHNNRENYLDVYQNVSLEQQDTMLSVIKETDGTLYQSLTEKNMQRHREQVIDTLLQNAKEEVKDLARKYLEGEITIDSLCMLHDKLGWISFIYHNPIKKLYELYQDEAFCRRCVAYVTLTLREQPAMYEEKIKEEGIEGARQIFHSLQQERVPCQNQWEVASQLHNTYFYDDKKGQSEFLDMATKIFAGYLKENQAEMKKVLFHAYKRNDCLALMVYETDAPTYKKELLTFALEIPLKKNISNIKIQKKLVEIFAMHQEWAEDVITLLDLSKGKDGARELAIQILQIWDNPDYKKHVKCALEKEKNGKIRAQMICMFGCEEGQEELIRLAEQDRKRLPAWIYKTQFSVVHKKDGTQAKAAYLQAILIYYAACLYVRAQRSSMTFCVSKQAAFLAESLNETEFSAYVNELYDKWLAQGADAKQSWVFYIASIYGGAGLLEKLQKHIQEWVLEKKGTIAGNAIEALAFCPQPQALLFLDELAQNSKNKKVKTAASNTLGFVAGMTGITKAQLEDRLVPDFGFNETVLSRQKKRFETVLFTERQWTGALWKVLFVKKPILRLFAIGLIWGIYEERTLKQCFCFTKDGSFCTIQGQKCSIPEAGKIGLVHPLELSEEERIAWSKQFAAGEVIQPFAQLDRSIYVRAEEEKDEQSLTRFGGKVVYMRNLSKKLLGFGWIRGPIQDLDGYFETYYKVIPELEIEVELHFSGNYTGQYDGMAVLYDIRFYQQGTLKGDTICYYNDALFLREVPQRLFSEIVLQFEEIAQECVEYEPNWKYDFQEQFLEYIR